MCDDAAVKRTTIFLPEDLHEQLRRRAFAARLGTAELIRLKLTSQKTAAPPAKLDDPLLEAAGVVQVGGLADNLDEELYDL